MAGEVTPDGQVIPPLNITNPTPALSLNGFQWRALEPQGALPKPAPAHTGQSPEKEATTAPPLEEAPPTAQVIMADAPKFHHRAAATPTREAGKSTLAADPPKKTPPADYFPIDQLEKTTFSGNGFNMIFRPQFTNKLGVGSTSAGPDDNILELNLTTEQWVFDRSLGGIPNRGLFKQPDVNLGGIPYLQTVNKVTDESTGRGSSLQPEGIHFEPGVFLTVPATDHVGASVVRMASIPHGTTINAQGLKPSRQPVKNAPNFNEIDTTPFTIVGGRDKKLDARFKSMNASKENALRIPANLQPFDDQQGGTGTITTAIIKNPNIVLQNALKGLDVKEHLAFTLSTGGPTSKAELNGGGTANIAFLAGPQPKASIVSPTEKDSPNAHAAHVSCTFWIETIMYDVVVPKLTREDPVQLRPNMPKDSPAPTPVFEITPLEGGNPAQKIIQVPGIQLQYSQNVDLNFATITWPHVSVATLVPTTPQKFKMTK